jgi:hypothetical protein
MVEKIKAVNNPLTIIAIFAALAEVAGTAALAAVDKELQRTFVWFVMGFPTLLVALFFITLNFNPKVLYAPSDFRNEENFINTLIGTQRVSMSLDEVKRQFEEAKSQILSQAIEQVTAANSVEGAKLENILDPQLKRIEAGIESARQTAQEVAYDVSTTTYSRTYVLARILGFMVGRDKPMTAAEIVHYARSFNVSPDATAHSLEYLVDRGIVKKVDVLGETAYIADTTQIESKDGGYLLQGKL